MVLRPTRPADWHGVPTCSTLYLGILWMKCLPVAVVRILGFSEWGERLGPSLITCSRSPCDIAGNKRHKTVTVLVWSFYKGILQRHFHYKWFSYVLHCLSYGYHIIYMSIIYGRSLMPFFEISYETNHMIYLWFTYMYVVHMWQSCLYSVYIFQK